MIKDSISTSTTATKPTNSAQFENNQNSTGKGSNFRAFTRVPVDMSAPCVKPSHMEINSSTNKIAQFIKSIKELENNMNPLVAQYSETGGSAGSIRDMLEQNDEQVISPIDCQKRTRELKQIQDNLNKPIEALKMAYQALQTAVCAQTELNVISTINEFIRSHSIDVAPFSLDSNPELDGSSDQSDNDYMEPIRNLIDLSNLPECDDNTQASILKLIICYLDKGKIEDSAFSDDVETFLWGKGFELELKDFFDGTPIAVPRLELDGLNENPSSANKIIGDLDDLIENISKNELTNRSKEDLEEIVSDIKALQKHLHLIARTNQELAKTASYKELSQICGPIINDLFEFEIKGAENIPEGGAIFAVAPHTSFFDGFALLEALWLSGKAPEACRVIADEKLFLDVDLLETVLTAKIHKLPKAMIAKIRSKILNYTDSIPLKRPDKGDKEGKLKAEKQLLGRESVNKIRFSDNYIFICPEGARNRQPTDLSRYHLGVGRLASESDAPVVPVAFDGCFEAWRPNESGFWALGRHMVNRLLGKPKPAISVSFDKPFHFSEKKNSNKDKLKEEFREFGLQSVKFSLDESESLKHYTNLHLLKGGAQHPIYKRLANTHTRDKLDAVENLDALEERDFFNVMDELVEYWASMGNFEKITQILYRLTQND